MGQPEYETDFQCNYIFLALDKLSRGQPGLLVPRMAQDGLYQAFHPLTNILSGDRPKDGIPPIDDPAFQPILEIDKLGETEPISGVSINGETKVYPLRILMRHETVNNKLGGVPITVTFRPLCSAAMAFDRKVGDKVLDFGTTGKLRNSNLLMWNR
jgi:hypothetical protein